MNNKIHTKKAQFAPESVYTPAEREKGIKPVVAGSGKGYALTTFPMADFLRSGDPAKAEAIQAIINHIKDKTGIKIDISEMPMLQILDPEDVYTVNGRPVIFLGYDSKTKTTKGVKSEIPLGSTYVDLTTMTIHSASDTDPVTVQHDAIISQLKNKSSEIINSALVNKHNKTIDWICSNKLPVLQNISAMLIRSRRLIDSRLQELSVQIEAFSKPRNLPQAASELDDKMHTDMGLSRGEGGALAVDPSFNPEGIDRQLNNATKYAEAIIIRYKDEPQTVLDFYNSGNMISHFANSTSISEDHAEVICSGISDIMKVMIQDLEDARNKREQSEKNRTEEPKEQKTIQWALAKIKPIIANEVKKPSIVPNKYKGIRSFEEQGVAANASITRTEIELLKETMENVNYVSRLMISISKKLRANGLNLSMKNISPSEKAQLCQAAQKMQRFTEGYAKPIVDENGKLDKRKMGSQNGPLANMLVSHYLGLCQVALYKLACADAVESKNILTICDIGNDSIRSGIDTETSS